ncbi:hypothetical protein [Haloparvum sp. PAK95]|uniref:hypothetical protein n=1 Tax=Haloparvum sp. PAK95 TaxID=3418962 RepID=UPI003D2EF717
MSGEATGHVKMAQASPDYVLGLAEQAGDMERTLQEAESAVAMSMTAALTA